MPLGLMEAASATDAAIQKNIFGSATTTIVFSIEGLYNIMKVVKALEEYGLWIKGVSETVENAVKEQKGALLGMLAAKVAASLLGSALASKGLARGGDRVIEAGEEIVRVVERQIFNAVSSFKRILRYKNIMKMNLDLMEFVQGIICPK